MRLNIILSNAFAFGIAQPKIKLRIGNSLLRCQSIPFHRLSIILDYALAVVIPHAKIILRTGMSLKLSRHITTNLRRTHRCALSILCFLICAAIFGYIPRSFFYASFPVSNLTPAITLEATQLKRSFGKHAVIHDISLQLKRGEVLGLLGANGAGKSTTMQMLTGCLAPDSGTVKICGIDLQRQPTQAKAQLGYLPETPPLYKEFSVQDYLIFAAKLRGIQSAEVNAALDLALQRCGLQDKRNALIGTLSKGYQQRVGIAQAIIHQPAVIILDEPTVGLDPTQIREIRTLIRELGNQHSVILSTHLLSEVESICDRVEIMQRGKLIYGDTSARMQQYGQVAGFTITLRNPPALAMLQGINGVTRVEALSPQQFRVFHNSAQNPSAELLTLAAQHDWQLEQLTPLQARLEDAFVSITDASNALVAPANLAGERP